MKFIPALLFIFIILIATLIFAGSILEKRALDKNFTLGVTFSDRYAKYLGFEPDFLLSQILDDLEVRYFRLPAYWDFLEPKKDRFEFSHLDKYIQEISKHQGKIILVVGYKLPRWPECHSPEWAKELSREDFRERQLLMVKKVVERYKDNQAILAFQVENELFMNFGICPKFDRGFIEKEVALVRSLSPKPIVMTDSGEVRPWISPARLSDILGISLYRKVYDPNFGHMTYPIPPFYYTIKDFLVRNLLAPNNQKTAILELQGEAWMERGVLDTPLEEQIKSFSVNELEEHLNFAKKTGFDEIYLWGVEWWYYLKVNNYPEYWEKAKEVF